MLDPFGDDEEAGGIEVDSILDSLLDRAEKRRTRKVMLAVPGTDLELVCDVPTSQETIDRLQEVAKKRFGKKRWVQPFSRALIANQTRRILKGDGPLLIDGEEVAFNDRALQSRLNAASAADAVSVLVTSDGEIIQIGQQLLREAGFIDDGEGVEADPI